LQYQAEDPRRQRVYTILLHRCEFVDEVDPLAQRLKQMATDFLRLLEEYFVAAQDTAH
jgi:TetR/AcrR family transcriptional repressor of mexAB-oprM operon